MEPREVSHLYSFARKCQINYFPFTWWRVMLIKGHMNNGRCHPGVNKLPSLPADNRVDQRLITHVNRRPIERFGGKGKHNFVKHSRFLSHFFRSTFLVIDLFIFPLIVFPFDGEIVVLMPFLPQDVSSNQRLHHWMGFSGG